jgi:TolB protein
VRLPWIAAVLVSCVLTCLTTIAADDPTPLVTLPQRISLRSALAPRSADVSGDGRFVAFESWARLVPADTDDQADIYVLERSTGKVTLESGTDDTPTEYDLPRLNRDGRFVVFEMRSQMVNHDALVDIVLRDRQTGINRVLSSSLRTTTSRRWSRSPSIDADGRLVAFSSSAGTTLAEGLDPKGVLEDVYVAELPSGTLRRVSTTAEGREAPGSASILPALSGDGQWIAFSSTADLDGEARDAIPRPINQIFLKNLKSGEIIRVSRPHRGGRPDGESSVPALSADGNYVAFLSTAQNLTPVRPNAGANIYLYDRRAGTTQLVSRSADNGAANGESVAPAISADGRFVAFQSTASNLECARGNRCPPGMQDINLIWDVFLFDRMSSSTRRVSDDELGGWMEASVTPALDATGHVIVFSSQHPMDKNDQAGDFDLFVGVVNATLGELRR